MNELDVLALTELTYLAFDDVVTQEPERLIDLASQIPRDTTMLTNKTVSSCWISSLNTNALKLQALRLYQ